ncbi:MAG: hypothetical protein HY220_03700 [Candidatus Sungbacteria bacterium]|uniref:GlsB/YeaQ/YmgE family stress response membrane protein n=1 Tax=Candidatus Sungiibacteriota bacterium TaxID=2750080 RepID=A0A9D6LUD9_9BACT|nr:hypothetical protein [Candidatus Sungbacteria bacterium]
MSRKSLIWIGLFVGSMIGGFIPELWGAGIFSFSGTLGSAVGTILGVWLAFKISN